MAAPVFDPSAGLTALPAPTASTLLFAPSLSPVLVVLVAAAWWYVRGVRRLPAASVRWSTARSASFATGLVLTGWAVALGPQAYGRSLFWVWTSQALVLLLITPVLLICGQPVELARRTGGGAGPGGLVLRFVDGPLGRFAGNAFIGPALVPVICTALFFGPLAGWSAQWPVVGWLVQLVVLLLGCLIVLPILDVRENRPSMVIGLALAIGFFELLLDAIPGIALRLQTHHATTFFDRRELHSWTPPFLRDQQAAGAILWTVAELLDLPFLVVVFVRWTRADAREAEAIDTVLAAERITRAGAAMPGTPEPDGDEPWWLSDPSMRGRLGRPEGPQRT